MSEATQIIFEDEEPLRGCLTERRVHQDRLLKIEEAFAMYIPALTPFPDTSANVK